MLNTDNDNGSGDQSLGIPVWRCHGCGQPVSRRGSLTIDFLDAWDAKREHDERTERERKADRGLRTIGDAIKDYLDAPEPAHWRAWHPECDHGEDVGYDIPLAKCDTWPKLVGWWVHLNGKAWIGATDWDEFVIEGGGVRV